MQDWLASRPAVAVRTDAEIEAIRERLIAGEEISAVLTNEPADPSSLTSVSAPAPCEPRRPPDLWGVRQVRHVPLDGLIPLIDRDMLFGAHWGFVQGDRPASEFAYELRTRAQPVLSQWLDRCRQSNTLQPAAVWGYWPANSQGGNVLLFDPSRPDSILARLPMPRADERVLPLGDGRRDVVAIQLVTLGSRLADAERELAGRNKFDDWVALHAIGVESLVAMAELVHRQIRVELGVAGEDQPEPEHMIRGGYRGRRIVFGSAPGPQSRYLGLLWPMLEPGRIDVSMDARGELSPERSQCAIVVA